MPAGPARGDCHLGKRADLLIWKGKTRNSNGACGVDPTLNSPPHCLRLLINLFEHEMRESILRYFGSVVAHSSTPRGCCCALHCFLAPVIKLAGWSAIPPPLASAVARSEPERLSHPRRERSQKTR